ncbi:cyclin-dependent kinase inhibitor 1B-like [Salarias fasciatus]|uniref:cyclin-dependent kinase inhibitor 1B-like n=1 Tax=Salarias fasciatus TaxID=181472 RepID=UPI001176EDFD|nr:cyclin-dependent kinase inhibitor 1B-like [Salarias fasciatus]
MCNKMSDVRLSNASPTLERVDARQADSFRPSVRRNLFGTPDPEEIRRYAAATLQEDVRGFRETYNFDPVEERPLSPRNYEWEEDRDPPEFYLRPPHGSQRDAAGEEGDRREGRRASRKRRSEGSGSCSGDCQSKVLHTDEDDDEEGPDGAGSAAAERSPGRPARSAEEAH